MRRLLLLASIIVLVDTSFYAAITPLLPDLVDEYGLSKTGAGLLAAAFPIGTFMGGLPGGWLAARIGVRPTVLIGLGLMTGASVAFAFAETILVLDLARFVQGLGSAAAWAGAMGWVAAAAPKEKRGQMIGTAMGAAIAGALFGPVIGVAADLLGHEIVFCAVGGVGLVLMVWTARTPAAKPLGDGSLRGLMGSLSDSSVRTGLLLVTVPGLMFGTLSVLGPLRLDELGAGAAAIGATWLIAAGLEAIVSPAAGHFSDRRGRAGAAARRPGRRCGRVRAAAVAEHRARVRDRRDPRARRRSACCGRRRWRCCPTALTASGSSRAWPSA